MADEYNHCIRAIAPNGTRTAARAVQSCVPQCKSFSITFYQYRPDAGNVRTLAGDGRAGSNDGVARKAQFIDPKDVAVLTSTRAVYVTDCTNQAIRVVSAHGMTDCTLFYMQVFQTIMDLARFYSLGS